MTLALNTIGECFPLCLHFPLSFHQPSLPPLSSLPLHLPPTPPPLHQNSLPSLYYFLHYVCLLPFSSSSPPPYQPLSFCFILTTSSSIPLLPLLPFAFSLFSLTTSYSFPFSSSSSSSTPSAFSLFFTTFSFSPFSFSFFSFNTCTSFPYSYSPSSSSTILFASFFSFTTSSSSSFSSPPPPLQQFSLPPLSFPSLLLPFTPVFSSSSSSPTFFAFSYVSFSK